MQAECLKGEPRDESRRLAAETAPAGGRLADHQVKRGCAILNIKIRQRTTANQLLGGADTFIEGEGEHLGGGESVANEALYLVAGERLVAMTGEAYELWVGIPTLERGEGLGAVWAQRNVLAHEDRLMSAD
jgi:hypothetical protein